LSGSNFNREHNEVEDPVRSIWIEADTSVFLYEKDDYMGEYVALDSGKSGGCFNKLAFKPASAYISEKDHTFFDNPWK